VEKALSLSEIEVEGFSMLKFYSIETRMAKVTKAAGVQSLRQVIISES
jgi:hypothetical protein